MSELKPNFEVLTTCLEALRATLAAEADALQKGDADALRDYIGRKEGEARALAAAWGELATRLGLSALASRETVEQALARVEPSLTARWADIVRLIDEIGRLNRLNGQLIQEQLRRTQTALEILQAAAGQGALYGADGRSIDLFSSCRSIDEA